MEILKTLSGFAIFGIIFYVYFLPSFIAKYRKHNNELAITVTNLFFGWTFIGWVISLIWASTNDTKKNDNGDLNYE
jgi:threonine/homoserine/homoserine lactone efflux protein